MISSASVWTSVIAPLATFAAAIVAVGSVGWAEARRLTSRHRHEERGKLQALIGEYRGRMLEAAVDWDRRMVQLYDSHEKFECENDDPNGVSQIERFLEDKGYQDPDPIVRVYGKYCQQREYMFRSYVYRLVALCAIARKFESEAFYIDSQFAHREDFEFLKFSKSFLWAVTTSDLPDDIFPGQDHIPNDDLRPILDSCYRRSTSEQAAMSVDPQPVIFDLPKLDALIERERNEVRERLAQPDAGWSSGTRDASEVDGDDAQGPVDGYIPQGFGKVLQLINGLRKPQPDSEPPLRLIWDRLCVLHLLTMAFIDEFGYPWQAHDRADLEQAVRHITDARTMRGFVTALHKPLALAPSDDAKPSVSHRRTKIGQSAGVIEDLLQARISALEPPPAAT